METTFNQLVAESIRRNWNLNALSDYRGNTLTYHDVAKGIEEIHILFEMVGVKKGDKVALCGRNSSNWGVIFLATLTYGAVCVPILHDFKAENIHNIVNHSDAKLFFVGDNVWENLDEQSMPNVKVIVCINDRALLVSRNKKISSTVVQVNRLYKKRFPQGLTPDDIKYFQEKAEGLAYISYTSGTTSFSKGVMIPYRSLVSNLVFAQEHLELKTGDGHVCMLPMAHAFGLLFSFLFEFIQGCHTQFLTRTPSPKIIFQAYADVRPSLIITVPLIVEKVIKKNVLPKLEEQPMKTMLRIPILRERVLAKVRQKIIDLFGGNFMELVIGGAALNEEVEEFMRRIKLPYTVGYGMTESGPLIGYTGWRTFKRGTCGVPVDRMQVKIDSEDPATVTGEILAKGDNVMLGYYKNTKSTAETIDKKGWLHTGDLGTMDAEGNITIRGRSKNMILGPSGQNIYPEEIEEKLNNLPYVEESIVVQKEGKIIALIHPNYQEAMERKLSNDEIVKIMRGNLKTLNTLISKYEQVSDFKIFPEEFEKTPKHSIKRYLYQ
ncbi:MAG: AMP-binding protein [Prevotella sp.]|nr:AMP-binding protein [Prevotella sp.]